MSNFVPCPACNRHVLSAETPCPFCTAALPESLRLQTPAPRPPGRLSRAALLAAGAALMGVGQACAGSAYGTSAPPDDAGADTSTIDGSSDSSAVALYGAALAALEHKGADRPDNPPTPKSNT